MLMQTNSTMHQKTKENRGFKYTWGNQAHSWWKQGAGEQNELTTMRGNKTEYNAHEMRDYQNKTGSLTTEMDLDRPK